MIKNDNNEKYYICIEIGGTNLRYSVIDDNFNIIEFKKIKTKYLSLANDKIEYLCINIIDTFIKKYNIKGIAFALASLLDKSKKIAQSSPMITGFNNIKLVEKLESKYNLRVYLEKDVNALLLYDMYVNKINKKGIVIGIYLGTGLGNAISLNNKIYYGNNGSSAELGHIPVVGFADKCDCGKVGCIELLISGRKLENICKNIGINNISEIFYYFDDSDELKRFVSYFAVAVATEITILDPELVFIGGGIPSMNNFPKKYFEQELKNNLRYPNPRKYVKILYSTNDVYSGVIGSLISMKSSMNL